MWDTDWDPFEILQQCQHNIHELARAHNEQSALVKHLAQALQHQQEVIQQLQFNDRQLRSQIERLHREKNQE